MPFPLQHILETRLHFCIVCTLACHVEHTACLKSPSSCSSFMVKELVARHCATTSSYMSYVKPSNSQQQKLPAKNMATSGALFSATAIVDICVAASSSLPCPVICSYSNCCNFLDLSEAQQTLRRSFWADLGLHTGLCGSPLWYMCMLESLCDIE